MSTKKVLFVASTLLHFHAFHRPYFKWFHDNGYEVHVACNGDFNDPSVSKVWNIGFARRPSSFSHISSIIQLKHIIDTHDYALVSCHTPMASVLSRLASRKARQRGTKLIYTAHGFHFFKGSSLNSWMLFFPIEVALSYITDVIVCINKEDFECISRFGSSKIKYYQIPGIGVDPTRFPKISSAKKSALRNHLGLNDDDFIIIYAAEFIKRKNHKMLIKAVEELNDKVGPLTVLLAGNGELLDETKNYIREVGLEKYFKFLGYVNNIEEYYQVADLVVSTSRQEGLGINLVEAMMCGIPPIATVDRGHCTIIDKDINGILCPQNDSTALANAILDLYSDSDKRCEIATEAIKKAEIFKIQNSLAEMSKIYKHTLDTV